MSTEHNLKKTKTKKHGVTGKHVVLNSCLAFEPTATVLRHLSPYLFSRVHAKRHALQTPPWHFFSKQHFCGIIQTLERLLI